eukprot:41665_1
MSRLRLQLRFVHTLSLLLIAMGVIILVMTATSLRTRHYNYAILEPQHYDTNSSNNDLPHRPRLKPHKPDDAVFPFYIFQIGFNKCATRTFTEFFQRNGIASCHYMHEGRNIHGDMMKRYSQNEPLLMDYYREFMFYADFAPSSALLWQLLFEEYPNARFILNIRNVNAWLRSRYALRGV